MKNNKALTLLLEEVEKEHLMEEVAHGIAHIVQLVAHKIAQKYVTLDPENFSEEEEAKYIETVREFKKIVQERISLPTHKPEGINTKMIANEFDKLINL